MLSQRFFPRLLGLMGVAPTIVLNFMNFSQAHGKRGGLSLRGVAVMTETAMTTETVKTATVASLCCILKDKQKEGRVLSRTAKTVMKAPPVRLGLSGRNSRKFPERPRKRSQSERSWNSPREYGWDAPNPIIQGI